MVLVNEIRDRSETFNSGILVMLIEALSKAGMANRDSLGIVVSHSRAVDCLPSVRACEVLLNKGDKDGAMEMLTMSVGSQGKAERDLAMAMVLLEKGDLDSAKVSAIMAYGQDPTNRRVYKILDKIDPRGGWLQRENIQALIEGRKPENPPGNGPIQELYVIYHDWYTGQRGRANEGLIEHQHYKDRDPEFLLASARMSMDEKDWISAYRIYNQLIAMKGHPFIKIEAAEAALGMGDHISALELLSRVDPGLPRVQHDIIKARLISGEKRELMDAIRSHLNDEHSNSNEYVRAVKFLLSNGMDREAGTILDRYSRFAGDDVNMLTMSSGLYLKDGDIRSSYIAARKAVHLNENSVQSRVQLAQVLIRMGKRAEAEKECSTVLVKDPGNKAALKTIMDMQIADGNYKGVIGTCKTILDKHPGDATVMIVYAKAMAMTGDENGAADMLKLASRTDPSRSIDALSAMLECGLIKVADSFSRSLVSHAPNDPLLKRLRGNAQYANGDYLGASVSFAEATAIDPYNPVFWYSKGMADEARGDLETAFDAFDTAVGINPDESEYWISKAAVQEAMGDLHGAVDSLNRAILLDDKDYFPLIRKAVILESVGRFSDALYFVRLAAKLLPGEVRITDMETDILASLGEPVAEQRMRTRLAKGPDEALSLKLSEFLLFKGRPEDALKVLDEALEAFPDSRELREERERVADGSIRPRIKPAVVPVLKEPEVKKEDAEPMYSMSVSLMAAGDLKGAMRMIDRALKVEPENQDFYCQKANIAMEKGDYAGVIFLCETALRFRADHAGLHEVAALAKEAKKDYKGALVEIDLAISCGLDTYEVHCTKGRILEALNLPRRAADSYSRATSRSPGDLDSMESTARQLFASGDSSGAAEMLIQIISVSPRRVSAIVLCAEVFNDMDDDDGVLTAFGQLYRCGDVPDEFISKMVRILKSRGHLDEAKALQGPRPRIYDEWVKRYAEKVLRRAYVSRTSPDDKDLMDALGFDQETSVLVQGYISEHPDFGPIVPAGAEFESLELRSHDVIVKLSWNDLEKQPRLPLEKVYVAGSFKDADQAKAMVAYIEKAMTSECAITDRIKSMMDEAKPGTVYEMMVSKGLGVYEAKALSNRASRTS